MATFQQVSKNVNKHPLQATRGIIAQDSAMLRHGVYIVRLRSEKMDERESKLEGAVFTKVQTAVAVLTEPLSQHPVTMTRNATQARCVSSPPM